MNGKPRGQVFQGNARDLLPPSPKNFAWILRSGTVDVFLKSDQDDAAPIKPHLLCNVGPGGLVMPVKLDDLRIDALPLAGSQLELVTKRSLEAEDWDRGLGLWWDGLAGGLEQLGHPRAQIAWVVDDHLDRDDSEVAAGSVLAAAEGLYWIRADGAQPRPFDHDMGEDCPDPLPLTSSLWCLLPQSATVTKLGTAALIADGTLDGAVSRFNALMLHLAGTLARAGETRNEARRIEKARSEIDAFDHLIGAAVESLDGRRLTRSETDAASPLLLACRQVAQWYGITVPDPATDLQTGSADARLKRLAMNSRFQIRLVKLDGRWWQEDNPALLAFDKADGSPVALVPGPSRGLGRHDPATGEWRALTADAADRLETHAYAFHAPFAEQTRTLLGVARMAHSADVPFHPLVLMVLATSLLAVVPPMIINILFDKAIPSSDFDLILELALSLGLIQVTTILITIAFEATLVRMEGKTMARLQAALFDRVLRLSSTYLRKFPLGKIQSKWMLFEKLHASAISRLFITATLTCGLSFFSLLVMFHLFPTSASLVLLLTVLMVTFAAKTGKWQLDSMQNGAALDGHYWSVVTEILRGIRKLRLAGAENRIFNRWFGFLVERRVRFLQGFRHISRLQVVMAMYEGAILLISLAVFSFQYEGHSLPMGQFMAFLAATKTFTHAVAMFAAALPDFRMTLVDDLPDVLPFLSGDVENPMQKKDPGVLHGGIEMAKISFRYEGSPRLVLDSVTVEAQPGEFVALVGPSGCGKSTILKLLLGMEQPSSGAVFYDGRDLRHMDVIAVRSQIGVVMQNASLIPGTIFDYISANQVLSLKQAWEAARLAGVDDVVHGLPMGMFTFISEAGASLSGGQMQRLMIARAISRRPRMLLFDEATSWLDNTTQRKIVETLSRLQITRIIIAHRLSTVRQADRIYVLDKGQVVDCGTFDQLWEKGGLFSDLVRSQLT